MTTEQPSREDLERWENRAPGWQVRCLKCGRTEPWGRYGVRLGAAGKKYTVGFCSRCRWLRFLVVERVPSKPPARGLELE